MEFRVGGPVQRILPDGRSLLIDKAIESYLMPASSSLYS
jgi:hypothetical protein